VALRVVVLFRGLRPSERRSGRIGISRHAVAFRLRNIYAKLQVRSKIEAVARVVRERLV
jgi:DNA-binding CsgD family transcriptional regulator